MKITVEYKGQPIEVDISEETLKMMAEGQKKNTGWEKPEKGDYYWCIDDTGKIICCVWANSCIDKQRYIVGNCYLSNTLACNIVRYRSIDARIRRRIAEICEPVDWDNEYSGKYFIYYAHNRKEFDITGYSSCHYIGWYCDTKEHARQIIEEFKDELMWYFTEFKDRMDG